MHGPVAVRALVVPGLCWTAAFTSCKGGGRFGWSGRRVIDCGRHRKVWSGFEGVVGRRWGRFGLALCFPAVHPFPLVAMANLDKFRFM